MNRRTLLRGGALAAGGGLATLAGLRLSSEEASAATTTLDVGGDQAVLDGGGEVLAKASASDSATLDIERAVELDAAEYGSVGGSGGLTIETA